MAIKIEMPKLSDTMEEGVIAKWNVQEGDKVESGDIIAEVETDKATMEVEVFDAGTILKILAEEGDAVPLGEPMAIVGEEDEDISELLESIGDSSSKEESGDKEEAAAAEEASDDEEYDPIFNELEEDKTSGSGNGRIKASPLARKIAEDKGIKLSNVKGSGPEGRIIKRDIEEYEPAAAPSVAPVVASREDEEIRISQMRKTIARRLAESKFTSPHFYETIDIDVDALFEARAKVNEVSEQKISFNDIIVKACSQALRKHPDVNSSWLEKENKIVKHGDVHVAVAVAIDEGLMTPVIRNTDQKGLQQISAETRELADLARNRKLQPEQMEGSTFTVSNLGMFGIEEFTAIINPPNACILAVGAIRDEAVVKDGEVVPGKRMKVTLSSDHRIVDGVVAAKFLNTLKGMLENPLSILL
ncbi:pyruvate dehydrogenase complex dihydrolipoamide acetyltransferase [Aliifodinibius sp. S!AR15-10]|uniref:pyruvate dehydrogenase complex dihydrolipoamide acetyltransferase n=1 Tax=Aliifodinibius sp. S!AR15-10 TaxID=2950437 RepID=UPI002858A761|nr:pyruvate dehydrogenase complex dihydrolipoamide acetyltransferase [Aliifodinibius sp. S!AR15-10]MDR8390862.1 pyruvate dehydrogenase complex dihydrolipoamide acetyltransferase [Aliifodinibius sp. S!AR15-10]